MSDIFDIVINLLKKIFKPLENTKIGKLIFKMLEREIFLYLFFGVLATVVSIASYMAAVWIISVGAEPTKLQINIANIVSWIITVSFAYVTNKLWVFESHTSGFKELIREMAAFFAARIFSLGFEIVWMNVFLWLFGTKYNSIYKIGAQVGIVIMNYVFSKLFIFKKANENDQ